MARCCNPPRTPGPATRSSRASLAPAPTTSASILARPGPRARTSWRSASVSRLILRKIRYRLRLVAAADGLLRQWPHAAPGGGVDDVDGGIAGADRVQEIGDDEVIAAAVAGLVRFVAALRPVGVI